VKIEKPLPRTREQMHLITNNVKLTSPGKLKVNLSLAEEDQCEEER
jgi:hypothetical protein